MKLNPLFACCFAFLTLNQASWAQETTSSPTPDASAQVAEMKAGIKIFATELQSTLKAAIGEGGLPAGIGVCSEKAAPIAQEVSQAQGFEIARTSLKVRNPDNAADAWELQVLQDFETQKQAGTPIAELEYTQVIEEEGQQVLRYMKAIPTQSMCLSCHGAESQIQPAVLQKLDELYPQDQARNFNEGDIRGAFTLRKLL